MAGTVMRSAALALIVGLFAATVEAVPVRLKDLGKFSGWRENALVGYGLVTGLAGTGDSSGNKATRQAIANMLGQFDVNLPPDHVLSRNAAAVMVTASLPPFATEGSTIDVTVTSIGDARSLTGGSLLLTPLKGANGKVYALAQGSVSVGGYKYDMNGNVVQKNHPTVGQIPAGATIEVGLEPRLLAPDRTLRFQLKQADYTTATRLADAVNGRVGRVVARPQTAETIAIQVPEEEVPQLAAFVAKVEALEVEPDHHARVVVNERTGTVVTGGDVRIDKVSVTQGDLKISIISDTSVSQPILVRQTGADVRTAVVTNSRVDVQEHGETGFVSAENNTVSDLVQSLVRLKTSTRDIISILKAIKAAGALHADLIIQ